MSAYAGSFEPSRRRSRTACRRSIQATWHPCRRPSPTRRCSSGRWSPRPSGPLMIPLQALLSAVVGYVDHVMDTRRAADHRILRPPDRGPAPSPAGRRRGRPVRRPPPRRRADRGVLRAGRRPSCGACSSGPASPAWPGCGYPSPGAAHARRARRPGSVAGPHRPARQAAPTGRSHDPVAHDLPVAQLEHPEGVVGLDRRSVGEPGLNSSCPSPPLSTGTWLWPKTTTPASGNRRYRRPARPAWRRCRGSSPPHAGQIEDPGRGQQPASPTSLLPSTAKVGAIDPAPPTRPRR